MANSVDPDQTDPIGAVCSGSTLFASILNSSVMLGNYLQQATSAGHELPQHPPRHTCSEYECFMVSDCQNISLCISFMQCDGNMDNWGEARIFLLVELRDFLFRFRVGGTKK